MKIKKIILNNYPSLSIFQLAGEIIQSLEVRNYSHCGGMISHTEMYEIFDSNSFGTLTIKFFPNVIPAIQFESSENDEETLEELEIMISKKFTLCEVENY